MPFRDIEKMLVMPERTVDAHKGTCGRTLVVAGSRGMTGAAALTAEAALRIGSGLVYLACPAGVQDVLATKLTSVITHGAADNGHGAFATEAARGILKGYEDVDVIALGPGIGRSDDTQAMVIELVRRSAQPMVIDADGLFAVAGNPALLDDRTPGRTILTPHAGELARLCRASIDEVVDDKAEWAIRFARRHGCIVVAKGPGTVVTDGVHAYQNTSGGPELATAGSGDVLTGLITGLVAQGTAPLQAAVLGVHLHGLCGQFGAEDWTRYGLISSDLVTYLPRAIREIQG